MQTLPKDSLRGNSYELSPFGQLFPIVPDSSPFIQASSGLPSRQFVPAAAESNLHSVMDPALFSSSEPVATSSNMTLGLLQYGTFPLLSPLGPFAQFHTYASIVPYSPSGGQYAKFVLVPV